ncbi:16S rRNA (cytosine(1402)-N(4))-methyltransferase RsmH [Roseococcus pinisoli]|uniref:Ribosomal RNA small subunit methyltransferase H n=1 Tax=Roseococcus pinisoli TaxID=2835040 RepID=A0ABS5QIR9_9PROT|nr:16S rRNA (cytosine(1402)-N(4))-methyltransferase RsmH [Roseococcus pinisoli]MBS7813546.1 16S rRNA (cytosine(1402)-N(4))-methyltransferase RsmH [Roseococcus pinisoli]
MTHIPVLLDEVLEHLAPRSGEVLLDGTFGGGGYARAILEAAPCTLWAMDRDPEAIARGAELAAAHPGRLHLIEGRFGDMLAHLSEAGVAALDGVVLDLGVSSFQIDTPERGFSFRFDGPLDMRMGRTGPSAADLVNTLAEAELADLLWEFGEERHSRRVARSIVRERAEAPFETTLRLAEVIRRSVPRDPSGIHGATRSFQALRIRVNDELGEIERALDQALGLLAPGGRIVVVSFHSLEDRIVKRAFQRAAGRTPGASRHDPVALLAPRAETDFVLLTPRSVRPGTAEAAANPRARSAHLRALLRKPESRAA